MLPEIRHVRATEPVRAGVPRRGSRFGQSLDTESTMHARFVAGTRCACGAELKVLGAPCYRCTVTAQRAAQRRYTDAAARHAAQIERHVTKLRTMPVSLVSGYLTNLPKVIRMNVVAELRAAA